MNTPTVWWLSLKELIHKRDLWVIINILMPCFQEKKILVRRWMVLSSNLHNGIRYTDKMSFYIEMASKLLSGT